MKISIRPSHGTAAPFPPPSPCAVCPWAGSWLCNTGSSIRTLVLIGTQFVMPKGLLRLQNAMFRLMPGSMFSASGLSKADTMRLSRSMMALDFRGCLARLRCPVLAVCGTGDHANQKAARQLCRLVPQGELALIPGAGHEVNTDAPEALAEVLVRFLRPLP